MSRGNKARSVLSTTKETVLSLLSFTKESSDVFPPLKSAASCILFIAETVDSFRSNKKEWRDLAIYLASTTADLSKSLSPNEVLSPSLEKDLNTFSLELQNLQDTITTLSKRSLLERMAQAKSDPARIAAFKIQIISAMSRFITFSTLAIRQRQESSNAIATAPASQSQIDFTILLPPKPSILHGRSQELSSILSSIKEGLETDRPARIVIRGAGGLGKTTLALSALHHEDCSSHFGGGERTYFISCEAATNASQVVAMINRTLNIPQSDADPLVQLKGYLKLCTTTTLLVLDNFETPWLTDDQPSILQILSLLDSSPFLTILITTRVTVLPSGIGWTKPLLPILGSISLEAAKDTFNDLTGEEHSLKPTTVTTGPSELEQLLKLVDMVPLAVTLLASTAQSGESISNLRRSWERERTALLADGSSSKATNIEVSIKLSLDSKPVRTNPDALRLLSLIAPLPDGADRDKLEEMSGMDNPDFAIRALKSVSLIYEEHGRLKILSPIRAYILSKEEFRPPREVKDALINFYFSLALKADCWIDDKKFLDVRRILEPESGNLCSIISLGIVDRPPSQTFGYAIFLYTRFLTVIGPSIDLLYNLMKREKWDQYLDDELKAKIMNYQTVVLTHADKFEEALDQSDRARAFSLETGVLFQAAMSLRNKGDTLRRSGRHAEALEVLIQGREEFDALDIEDGRRLSLECSEQMGTVMVSMGRYQESISFQSEVLKDLQALFPGEKSLIAHTLRNIAMAYSYLGNDEQASAYAEDSYFRFKELGYVRGEATALWVLGMNALKNLTGLDHEIETAVKLLTESVKTLVLIGDYSMASNVYTTLGLTYGKLKKLDEAKEVFDRARDIFKEQGKDEDYAQCFMYEGTILEECLDPQAVIMFRKARKLFLDLDLKRLAAQALSNEGRAALRTGTATTRELLQMFDTARLELYEAGDLLGACWACYFEGSTLHTLREYARAEIAFKAAVEGFEELGTENIIELARKSLENNRNSLKLLAGSLDEHSEPERDVETASASDSLSRLRLS